MAVCCGHRKHPLPPIRPLRLLQLQILLAICSPEVEHSLQGFMSPNNGRPGSLALENILKRILATA